MDETLIHTDFIPSFKYESTLEVMLDGEKTTVYLSVRPGMHEFIELMHRHYELIIFTASVSSYASPIINLLDKNRVISHRLFRQHCKSVNGSYIKDLSKIGRNLKDVIIVDNLPLCYILQQENGIPIKSWMGDDKSDNELSKLSKILEKLSKKSDVRKQTLKHKSIILIINVVEAGKRSRTSKERSLNHNRSETKRINLQHNIPRVQYSAEPTRKSEKYLKNQKKKLGVELRSCDFSKAKPFNHDNCRAAYNSNHIRNKQCKRQSKERISKESKHLRNTYSNYLENNLCKALKCGFRNDQSNFQNIISWNDNNDSKIEFDENTLSKAYNEFINGKNINNYIDNQEEDFEKENILYIDARNPKNPASIPSSFNCKNGKKHSRNLKAECNDRELSQKYSNRDRKLSRGGTKSDFELFKSQKHERRYSDITNKSTSYFKNTHKDTRPFRKPSLNHKTSVCTNKLADEIIGGEWINICMNKRYPDYKNLSGKIKGS